jgi:hypothetical protein
MFRMQTNNIIHNFLKSLDCEYFRMIMIIMIKDKVNSMRKIKVNIGRKPHRPANSISIISGQNG